MTEEQKIRYSRHFVLKEIGEAGQKKLLKSKVLVIGVGALAMSSMYLAAAGVGIIGLVDLDKVDPHNLQRQIIHRTNSIGEEKVFSAARTLKEINPDVKLELYTQKVDKDNIQGIIKSYDFVLDCTDRFETKFLINDACVLSNIPYCHAGAVRFEGQVMTVLPGKGPCLRCLLGDIPPQPDTSDKVGVLGAVTGVIGSVQALEAIKFLVGKGETLSGKVFKFDGLNMTSSVIEFGGSDPNCKVCGAYGKKRLSIN